MDTIIIVALIVLFFVWRMMPAKGVVGITTDELRRKLNNKDSLTLLDVRTPSEFKANHIQGAINLPLGQDLSVVPKDKDVVVICQSGMRSSNACKQLKRAGYSNIYNVRGGMNAWKG